jgi:hypothetical protein
MKTLKHYDWIMWAMLSLLSVIKASNEFGKFENWPVNIVIYSCALMICMAVRMRASD